jgi:nucleotide-binding universal stress UspA family protein
MHVIVATDGSRASLAAARQFKRIADSREITDVTIVAVVSPYAAVPFANELGPRRDAESTTFSFGDEAEAAADAVAAEFEGWGPKIHQQIRSGSPAQEIVRAAEDLNADLVSMAAGGRGLTPTILLGSTASRVQHSAPCPVLICRPVRGSKRHRPPSGPEEGPDRGQP